MINLGETKMFTKAEDVTPEIVDLAIQVVELLRHLDLNGSCAVLELAEQELDRLAIAALDEAAKAALRLAH
jgi:hypothetical protein